MTNTDNTMDRKDKGQKGGDTMYKKDKRQIQAIQWTKKSKDKHRRYNGQKRQRTNRGHTMDKKDK
jgi:hypothetical protein